MLGENAEDPSCDLEIAACKDWLRTELVSGVVPNDAAQINLTFDNLSKIIVNCRRPLPSEAFFRHFFANVKTIDDFEKAIEAYRIVAMLLYGNFKYAFRRIATADEIDLASQLADVAPLEPDNYTSRTEFDEIEDIEDEDLPLLGYISGPEVDDLSFGLDIAKQLSNASPAQQQTVLHGLRPDKLVATAEKLTRRQIYFPESATTRIDDDRLSDSLKRLEILVPDLVARRSAAQDKAIRNTHRYLSLAHLDVYVATSMRSDEDYKQQHQFVKDLFAHREIAPLNLRYFDPTISYDTNRISKGLIECLMLRRADVTVYHAGAEDTMGKDSELAATLAQGKAVIAYVPEDPAVQHVYIGQCDECHHDVRKKVNMSRRAEQLREKHPLGLQLDMKTGVAHGVIVVTTIEECALMLKSVLLRQLEFQITHQDGMFRLVENSTKSIVRAVSDDPHLTHAFWTYFHQKKAIPKAPKPSRRATSK